MEWQDHGAVLAVRKHGETATIVEVFTESRGRHAGVVRGGASRKMTPVLQPGNHVAVSWRARLESHIGSYTVEPLRGRAAILLGDRLALAGLNAVCALCSATLPERHAYPQLYVNTMELLDLLSATTAWPLAYLRWEVQLLEQIGFGLDLSACATTGETSGLIYISPRSGRAVSAAGAGEWAKRLLPLPPVLLGEGDAPTSEIAEALGLTGYFLQKNLPERGKHKGLPPARARLVDLLTRQSGPREKTI